MANRPKRSISLPAELDSAIEQAASLQGTSVSGWLAQTAAHRLKIEAGWHGIEAWEADNGRLTAAELADGRQRAKEALAVAEAVGPANAEALRRFRESS